MLLSLYGAYHFPRHGTWQPIHKEISYVFKVYIYFDKFIDQSITIQNTKAFISNCTSL